ncbi:GntR family transcriptional regulator [Streptomyces sp. BpilaLS-43]|uniref:GntR family transcriptional regulator n=1 Tax=Streptomyces sp. BpilaLS-43 TaxID=1839778 RepID=UPI000B87FB5E|nr:GntR family transcriptional regulator [Streptomyces sp. BpilaLS-43]
MREFETMIQPCAVYGDTPEYRSLISQFVTRWLPLAEKRLCEADGSPADQARWQGIIAGVQGAADDATVGPSIGTLARNTWSLLDALACAALPGPSIQEIAGQMRRSIADGTYVPGILLTARRIATEYRPTASILHVRLAASDLEAEGLITLSPSDHIRVVTRQETTDRPERIAAWLSVLIQSGVYTPGSRLPALPKLARALVSPTSFVSGALGLLHDTGVVTRHRGMPTTVRPTLPFGAVTPPDVHSLLPMLWNVALPDVDLSHTGIRETCHRTYTWWRSRLAPHPDSLDHTLRALAAAAEYLLPLVAQRHPDNVEVHATLRRTAVTALAVRPPTSEGRIWRAACLGAAVLEVLHLAGDAV